MSEGNGWLVLQVTMGEEDPLHLIAAGIEQEVYVLGIDDGRAKMLHGLSVVTWLRVGDIASKLKVTVGGREAEMWVKHTEGSKAKIAIRGPEVRFLRHKLWLDNQEAA